MSTEPTVTQITVSSSDARQLVVTESIAPDKHPALVYIAGLTSPHSRRNMTRYLNQIADLLTGGRYDALALNWGAIRVEHTKAIRARLIDHYAPATVNVMLSALRGVIKAAWELGYMDAESRDRATNVKNVKVETLPAGRDIKQGEFLALAETCYQDDSAAGVRDSAIIGLLYTCGLRRAELVNLQTDQFDPDTGQLKVIGGKGRKDRTVYVTNGALDALQDWLTIRGDTPGAIFLPINKGGRIDAKDSAAATPFETSGRVAGMTAQAVYNMLKKRASQAGVNDFSPHDFRRTFVGDLLDRGADIVTVQKLAGHASVETTGRYDRRPEAVKKQAASKLHFPYKRRERLID
jgi:site-specific recombinase XerD